MIKLENVTKRYGAARGVEDISFEVGEGEILGFLGPNGAGKTTTLRVITGYHPATSGRVTVNGYDIFEQAQEAKRQIGYLPEIPPLYHDATVREQLEFVARVKRVPASQRKQHLDNIAQRVGITEVYHRLIRNLSKGYRQRVGLAQALVGNPPVLILDEPTIGLDPRQIIEIRQLLRDLKGEHTVIISSHILPEISQLCQRVVIINEGRLVAVDTPEALSRRLRQGQRVLVRIDGPHKEVFARLHDLPGVAEISVVPEDDGQPGRLYDIQVQKDVDIRRDLSEAMAEAKWPILEMKSHDMSLEDVLLKLVTEEDIGFDSGWTSSETDAKEGGVSDDA